MENSIESIPLKEKDFMEYINIIATVQLVFLFFILFFKNKNILNKILGLIILTPIFSFTFNTLDLLNALSDSVFGVFYHTIIITSFLFAPLVFYYINMMCGKRMSFKHPLFIATLVLIAYDLFAMIKFLLLTDLEKKNFIEAIKNGDFPTDILYLSVLFFIIQQLYFTLSAIQVYRFRKKVSNTLSYRSSLGTEFTLRFIILAWGANIISLICYFILPMRFVEFVMLPIILFIISNFIFYYAFRYQVFFHEDTYRIFLKDLELVNTETELPNLQGKKSLHAKTINEFLETKKAYLNPEYTIFDLSKDLGYSYSEVSNIINKDMGYNFSKLINRLRVEEAKIALKENIDSLTVEAIGKMAGFKSRASFYRVFKSETGKTPLEYLKSQES